ncbi:MAG: hypothetical protein JWO45_1028 [Spartobacteria bacterium]|nr:hypothetical protein [Spartobacteria bacterium]
MKSNRIVSTSTAAFAVALTFVFATSSTQAGGPGSVFNNMFRGIDGTTRVSPSSGTKTIEPIVNPSGIGNPIANRGGLDDPANHDLADDRGANQPGDDRGRHHRRGHR